MSINYKQFKNMDKKKLQKEVLYCATISNKNDNKVEINHWGVAYLCDLHLTALKYLTQTNKE